MDRKSGSVRALHRKLGLSQGLFEFQSIGQRLAISAYKLICKSQYFEFRTWQNLLSIYFNDAQLIDA